MSEKKIIEISNEEKVNLLQVIREKILEDGLSFFCPITSVEIQNIEEDLSNSERTVYEIRGSQNSVFYLLDFTNSDFDERFETIKLVWVLRFEDQRKLDEKTKALMKTQENFMGPEGDAMRSEIKKYTDDKKAAKSETKKLVACLNRDHTQNYQIAIHKF
ncbi:MAG: hypothetical protein PF572_00405 [Patescibacteria group bacterium]|jgi:hypothetical protein|nr:hypothetical protein [Patescibacteria group bacterium]